jgi:hypothetical protein
MHPLKLDDSYLAVIQTSDHFMFSIGTRFDNCEAGCHCIKKSVYKPDVPQKETIFCGDLSTPNDLRNCSIEDITPSLLQLNNFIKKAQDTGRVYMALESNFKKRINTLPKNLCYFRSGSTKSNDIAPDKRAKDISDRGALFRDYDPKTKLVAEGRKRNLLELSLLEASGAKYSQID